MKIHKGLFIGLVSFLVLFLSATEGNTQTPVASFLTNPASNTLDTRAPVGVQFTDTSTGNPTWWLWEFGDGEVSLDQHPLYLYEMPGIYTVTLSVGNEDGVDTYFEDYTVLECVINPSPVLLENEDYFCGCIMEAYDEAITLGCSEMSIALKAGTLEENLHFDTEACVQLKGGYDCTFQNNNLQTTIVGSLRISAPAHAVRPSRLRIVKTSPVVNERLCDGLDNDGDGLIDENLIPPPCFRQKGICAGSVQLCLGDLGWSGADSPECYGQDYEVTETTCDGLDNDCDGQVDEGLTFDADGDGFTTTDSCAGSKNDCDDNDPNNFPGNTEICDGQDNNCDGQIDDIVFDVDNDGYTSRGSCSGSADDCNDYDGNINPGATEYFGDGIDQDCDGLDVLEADNDCSDCHAQYEWINSRHFISAPDGTCANCHAIMVSNILSGHYGQTVGTAGNNMAAGSVIGCKSCHDWHDEEESGLQWGDYIVWQKVHAVGFGNTTCNTCHENHAAVHTTGTAHDNRIIDSICSNCHTSDTSVLGSTGTGTLLSDEDVDTLHRSDCALCHNYTGTKVAAAVVAQAIQDGSNGTQITCLSCHGSEFPTIHVFIEGHYNLVRVGTTSCGNCHSDAPPLVDADDPKVHNACTSCHDANWNRISLAAGKSAPGDCTTCHGDHFPNHSHHNSVNNDVSYNEAVDTSQPSQQGCTDCHHDYDNVNSTSLGLGTWVTILVEHDLDGTKDGSTNTCDTCHAYDGSSSVPLAVVQNAVASGNSATCVTCHTDKVPDVEHGVPISGKHQEHLDMESVGCSTCHNTGYIPYFKSGTDVNGDGLFTYTEADVCNTCHSPSGSYDGVNDPDYGAKANWHVEIYNPDGSLQAGKEKWCAGCHDEVPSEVNGVLAPNVIGDEDGIYTYGSGWGYYKTGHGLAAAENYPSKGSAETLSGRPIECDACHDYSTSHIDGKNRTFDCSDGCDPDEYRYGYRLLPVDGENPMEVPWTGLGASSADKFRICVQTGCHDPGPFTDSANTNTNLRTFSPVEVEPDVWEDQLQNRHEYHLSFGNQNRYPADYVYDGLWDSRINCITCHNVHGSTRLAMVRDGKLINREPGLLIYYRNDITSYPTAPPTSDPPVPADLPLSASNGTVWRGGSSANLCSHCHANGNLVEEFREPYQNVAQAPTLDWTGETNYESDGVNPDIDSGESSFYFRVKYTDANNDAPDAIEVWIDLNDDGDYLDSSEKLAMTEAHDFDANYTDGKLYYRTETLSKAGDNYLNYRFYASDGADATGPPVNENSVRILNNIPALAWTGETHFVSDGVNPDTGGNNASFEFRVSYTDVDNEEPITIQIWIDEDDSGTYEISEMYDLSAVDGDSDYTDGKLYLLSTTLATAGDGELNYRFYATDGFDDATGLPAAGKSVTVLASANNPPNLYWTSALCLTDGVRPGTGIHGTEFEFLIVYSDPDNECPPTASDIQVWIDEDDNGTYEGSEQKNLTEVNPSDSDCSDGKLYSTTINIFLAGDNSLNFRFYATDGLDDATGDPVFGSTLTVLDGVMVRPPGSSLPYDYDSVFTAANAVNGNILVYPHDDFTAATYSESTTFNNRDNLNIRSACGADLTIISGSGTVVTVQSGSANFVIDGFSITGDASGAGIQINGVDNTVATIKNSKIYSKEYGIYINDSDNIPVAIDNVEIYNNTNRGIYLVNADDDANISNCEIYSNSVGANSGAAITMNNGNTVNISNTIIRNNTTTGWGGAIYVNAIGSNLTIEDSSIYGNQAGTGGALYMATGASSTLNRSVIRDNIATVQGGAIYTNAANFSMTNTILTGNQAGSNGGAISTNSGPVVQIINSTVADNHAANGGAIYMCATGTTTISNSIFWNNAATSGNGANIFKACGAGNIGTVSYSNMNTDSSSIYNASFNDGGGIISPALDPLFVGGGDYHIQSGSPCVDAIIPGNFIGPSYDIDGDTRPQNIDFDIGADEYGAP